MYLYETRSMHVDEHDAAIGICAMDDGRVAVTAYGVLRNDTRSNLWMYTYGIADAEALLIALSDGGTVHDQSGGRITIVPCQHSFIVTAFGIRAYHFNADSIEQMRTALRTVIDATKAVPEAQRYVPKTPTRQPVDNRPKYIGQGI